MGVSDFGGRELFITKGLAGLVRLGFGGQREKNKIAVDNLRVPSSLSYVAGSVRQPERITSLRTLLQYRP